MTTSLETLIQEGQEEFPFIAGDVLNDMKMRRIEKFLSSFTTKVFAAGEESGSKKTENAILGYDNWTEWERKTLSRLLETARTNK